DAKVGHLVRIDCLHEPPLRLLLQEEGSQLVFHHLENQAEILANEFIVFCHLVANRPEWTTARHAKALLEFHMGQEPSLKALPRRNLVFERCRAISDRIQMRQKHLMDQTFLAFKIVIKLALPCPRSFYDLVWAGRADSLFME